MSNNYYTVACEYCEAGIGMPCVTNAGKQTSTHKLRIDAANQLAMAPLEAAEPEVVAEPVVERAYTEPEIIPALVMLAMVMPPAVPTTPKQVLHVISGGTLGKQSRIFYPGLPTEFSMEKHFKMHETRPYLEQHMPCDFAIVSEDDLDVALTILSDGLKVFGFDGEVMTGFVKDGIGATLILTPRGVQVTLADLGVRCMITKSTDVGKFMKYLKRLFAMYRHSAHGTDQIFAKDNRSNVMIYKSGGQVFRIRHDAPLPAGFVIEGCSFVSPRWANAQLGLNPDTGKAWRVGQTARITFTCHEFMWKGHVMVWDMKNIDATFWDCKRIIGTEDVFVGLMGTLHAGDLHLGSQEIVDWGLMEYAAKLGKQAIESYADQMHAPDFATKKFDMMFGEKLKQEDPDGTTAAQIAKWRFMNAQHQMDANGKPAFDFHQEPFMQRDGYRAFEQNVCDVNKGRVPVPATSGFRAYYFIDPYCITDDGMFNPKMRRLQGNCVYNSKLKHGTRIVTFRNPHTIHEYIIGQAVAPSGRFDLIDDQVMLVSIDIAMNFAEVQGGGDYDDCGNVYFDREIVQHFLTKLPSYPARLPAKKRIKAAVEGVLEGNFLARRYNLHTVKFDKVQLADKIRAVRDSDAGVGMIDNYLRVSMTLSLYLPEIHTEIEERIAESVPLSAEFLTLKAAQLWLSKFVQYNENEIASAYEDAIDNCVMNGAKGGVDASLGQTIRTFWANCPIVPYWATVGGFDGNGKIPNACRQNNPLVVMDPISKCIKLMQSYGDALTDLVNIKQWLGLQMAPAAVRSYPCTPEVKEAVKIAIDAWKQSNRKLRDVRQSKKASYVGFRKICKAHRNALDLRGHEFSMMFMAELVRRAYDGPYGSPKMFDGKPIGGPDGYVNQPDFFPLRVQLLKELGLVVKEEEAVTVATVETMAEVMVDVPVQELEYEAPEQLVYA